MPNYGEKEYWDERYCEDAGHPFDWLFDFIELKGVIEHLLPDKNEQLFLVGCGNAPFSYHLESFGNYTDIWNTDISPVVIEQQAALFPNQRWDVMDVLDMSIPDSSVPVILDKSLFDTLLCCSGGATKIEMMMGEIHRILAPGSRFISFSLHPIEEVIDKYKNDLYSWKTAFYRIKSKRWNAGKNRKRSTSHTMIVCDMPSSPSGAIAQFTRQPSFDDLVSLFPGLVLSEEEDVSLKLSVEPVLFRAAMKLATMDTMLYCLYEALCRYGDEMNDVGRQKSASDKQILIRLKRQFIKWQKEKAAKEAEDGGSGDGDNVDGDGDTKVSRNDNSPPFISQGGSNATTTIAATTAKWSDPDAPVPLFKAVGTAVNSQRDTTVH